MFAMTTDSKPTAESDQQPDAAQHIAEAHRILRALQLPLNNPELEKAIDNLEMALSILTTKTGGML